MGAVTFSRVNKGDDIYGNVWSKESISLERDKTASVIGNEGVMILEERPGKLISRTQERTERSHIPVEKEALPY